jgi:hypothetical protein
MRAALQYAGWLVGLPLELLIIAALVRGAYRRLPFLLLYCLALFLTTVVEISVNQAYYSGIHLGASRATYYWIDEAIRQLLIFAVVVSFIYLTTARFASRSLLRASLIIAAIAFAGGSFWLHYNGHAPRGEKWTWMTLWVRDLDFSAAFLDLALWGLLLASRKRNLQLLMLAGGLGIQFTGEAIGQSLRYLVRLPLSPGDVIGLVTNLAGLWIWWQALRTPVVSGGAPAVGLPRSQKWQ